MLLERKEKQQLSKIFFYCSSGKLYIIMLNFIVSSYDAVKLKKKDPYSKIVGERNVMEWIMGYYGSIRNFLLSKYKKTQKKKTVAFALVKDYLQLRSYFILCSIMLTIQASLVSICV